MLNKSRAREKVLKKKRKSKTVQEVEGMVDAIFHKVLDKLRA